MAHAALVAQLVTRIECLVIHTYIESCLGIEL